MICLALDTALDACSVAVVEGERVLARRSEPMVQGHQERLAPMVAEAMAAAGLDFTALRRVGVTTGPGSFTGVRVGLAFARATALALDIECVGVGALRALAAGIEPSSARLTVAALDARRGQLYVQAFRNGLPAMTAQALEIDAATEALLALGADASTPVAGSGARLLVGVGSGAPAAETIDPVVLARLAVACPPGEGPPQPLYLRAPDARTLAERAAGAVSAAPAIFRAEAAEAEALARLHALAFDRPWSARDLGEMLAASGGFALSAGRPPLGFVLVRALAGEAEILTLAVAPAARRRGLGRALVYAAVREAAARGARSLWLEVADDNAAARALYAACGFAEVGLRRAYYLRPGGAVDARVLRATAPLQPG